MKGVVIGIWLGLLFIVANTLFHPFDSIKLDDWLPGGVHKKNCMTDVPSSLPEGRGSHNGMSQISGHCYVYDIRLDCESAGKKCIPEKEEVK